MFPIGSLLYFSSSFQASSSFWARVSSHFFRLASSALFDALSLRSVALELLEAIDRSGARALRPPPLSTPDQTWSETSLIVREPLAVWTCATACDGATANPAHE